MILSAPWLPEKGTASTDNSRSGTGSTDTFEYHGSGTASTVAKLVKVLMGDTPLSMMPVGAMGK
jgi:hypothetical protein